MSRKMAHTPNRSFVAVLTSIPLLAVTAGCVQSTSDGGGFSPEHPVGAASVALTRSRSCDDLVRLAQADALAHIEVATAQYLEWYAEYFDRGGGGGADAGAAAPAPADGAGSRDEGPSTYSETNVQVEGVDEADIVKTDGRHIYALAGNRLHVLRSWPANETSLLASFDIEGYVHEMFVAEGRALVFSQTGDPRGPAEGDARCAVPGARDRWRCGWGAGFTKLTEIALDELSSPQLVRELYVEGEYLSSRRHGDRVRAIITNWGHFFDWNLPSVWEYLYPEPGSAFGGPPRSSTEARLRILAWRRHAIAYVRALRDVADWVPAAFERDGGLLRAVPPRCDGFYFPGPGMTDVGMTQIVGIELRSDTPIARTGISGRALQVYANADTMLLAQPDYSVAFRAWRDDADIYEDRTVLHRFRLEDGIETVYEASGVVPGVLVDQFAMDERDGVVRVATTQTRWRPWWEDCGRSGCGWTEPETTNQVLTLRTAEPGALVVVGSTGPMAPGERVFSARFVGDRGYVVTFRRVDPLFVVDLSVAERPRVLGELKIPGFSTYMHPLGVDHLLTIGYEADEASGRVLGLALQIFDVSVPTRPTLKHKHVFEREGWSGSEAAWDHRAFTYYGHLNLLAFPYFAWNPEWTGFRSSLEVFEVDVEEGLRPVGSINHSELLAGRCTPEYGCHPYEVMVRRGVFIEDYVYSLSEGGVLVHHVSDLGREVARVPFVSAP
ncbi:MAG: beta-propeller domain-containing protein [Myxococcota bacterium]|nr:beta-propeller domain-containing protein [Myxococcota bacterium]MDW8362525.1 beta-propeller domain-containing protein [Myxococcales bacterium]